MLGLTGREVHQSSSGWSPVWVTDGLGVMSIGFMLPQQDNAVIWRGPKKNGLIKQFLTVSIDVTAAAAAAAAVVVSCRSRHASTSTREFGTSAYRPNLLVVPKQCIQLGKYLRLWFNLSSTSIVTAITPLRIGGTTCVAQHVELLSSD